jgi:dipeptidyl-peptidase III
MKLYNCCSGGWENLAKNTEVDISYLQEFLTYAATFLSNVGNYYVLDSEPADTCTFVWF